MKINHDELRARRESLIDRVEDWSLLYRKPLVSVAVGTFNHEPYIRQCLDSVLMQQVSFDYEVVLWEDNSVDQTREIVLDYQQHHPDKIRLRLARENLYSQGIKLGTRDYYRGKYIAMLEGDDCWTDPLKLQKQVDFLKANPDCSLCFHATEPVFEQHPEKNFVHRPMKVPKDHKFEMKHAISGGGGFMATNSMMFKRECINEQPLWRGFLRNS